MSSKLVSIIISTYNNASTIRKCFNSIKNQSYKNLEIIIVDEWSKDKTVEIAKEFGAQVYHHGKERANNRNYGIKKAKGEYYFILDSDMELEKNVIAECVQICTSGRIDGIIIPEKSIGYGYWAKVRGLERIYNKGNDSVEAARFFPRDVIKKIGGYDPEIVGAEDWDLQQRFFKHGFNVARTKNFIIHNEGSMQLSKLLGKKMYYGKAFLLYNKRYPDAFKKAVLRKQLFKNWYSLILRPKYGIGVFILKFLEGLALFTGMFMAKIGISVKHY